MYASWKEKDKKGNGSPPHPHCVIHRTLNISTYRKQYSTTVILKMNIASTSTITVNWVIEKPTA